MPSKVSVENLFSICEKLQFVNEQANEIYFWCVLINLLIAKPKHMYLAQYYIIQIKYTIPYPI